jgi:hypothetical protein
MPFYPENPPAKQRISDENGFSIAELQEFFNDLKTS